MMWSTLREFLCLVPVFAVCISQECRPLHLSPFIQQGNIQEALELSQVFDPLNIIPQSYSGFITTDYSSRNHLFFWFFPALLDSQAPLLIWLNGGPAESSMIGLVFENGPIRAFRTSNGSHSHVSYERRPHSWSNHFSMLYIDNPVGTGYSYSETKSYKTTQTKYSEEMLSFLQQFYQLFPAYLARELYIGGESYAGKYVPAIAYRIHKEIVNKRSTIPLSGIYIGGPFLDVITQTLKTSDYLYAMGAISLEQRLHLLRKANETINLLKKGIYPKDIYEAFENVFPNFGSRILFVDNYEQADQELDLHILVQQTIDYISTHIHVCNLSFLVVNLELRQLFTRDFMTSVKRKLKHILNNYKVLIYTGDQDGKLTSPMVDATLLTIRWSQGQEYRKATRNQWQKGNKLLGFYSQTGQFCRVVIRGAGHRTPYDRPEATLEMMRRFIKYGCI